MKGQRGLWRCSPGVERKDNVGGEARRSTVGGKRGAQIMSLPPNNTRGCGVHISLKVISCDGVDKCIQNFGETER
jgi:hypothetical protein